MIKLINNLFHVLFMLRSRLVLDTIYQISLNLSMLYFDETYDSLLSLDVYEGTKLIAKFPFYDHPHFLIMI